MPVQAAHCCAVSGFVEKISPPNCTMSTCTEMLCVLRADTHFRTASTHSHAHVINTNLLCCKQSSATVPTGKCHNESPYRPCDLQIHTNHWQCNIQHVECAPAAQTLCKGCPGIGGCWRCPPTHWARHRSSWRSPACITERITALHPLTYSSRHGIPHSYNEADISLEPGRLVI